jgi:uncharacterized coiled-coil protein SlyX
MSGGRAPAGGCGRAATGALAAALALLLAGCAAAPGGAPAGGAPAAPPAASVPAAAVPPAPTVPRFPSPLTPEWIAARIVGLEAARKPGTSADPDGVIALELALLHSHPANPAPDHVKALAMMRAYLALAPPGSRDPLVLHVAGLLEDIDQLGRIAREGRGREKELAAQVQALEQRAAAAGPGAAAKKREQELQAQVTALQQQVATLQGQIATLQQRIEQLQQLDLEMEKRRRSVK